MIFKKNVENFIKELQSFEKMENVFNPWQDDGDKEHDLDEDSPKKRAENLRVYLLARENAKYVLIAEAPGYQGCHFSGIPMTSERLILTNNAYGLEGLERTSDYREQNNKLAETKIYTTKYPNGRNIAKTVIKNGFAEPTATIVWKQMVDELDIKPTDFVLWNAFPFHPYNAKYGYLSNRKPADNELELTKEILVNFLDMFTKKELICCIGNVSQVFLANLKNGKYKDLCKDKEVRHPANGGANYFRNGIQALIP